MFPRSIVRIVFSVSLIAQIHARQLFDDSPLTFGQCEQNADCFGDRNCLYHFHGKLFACDYVLQNCLCVPKVFQQCSSSTQCPLGERCVKTEFSVNICVACLAAEFVPSFLPVDSRSKQDCTWTEPTSKRYSKYFGYPKSQPESFSRVSKTHTVKSMSEDSKSLPLTYESQSRNSYSDVSFFLTSSYSSVTFHQAKESSVGIPISPLASAVVSTDSPFETGSAFSDPSPFLEATPTTPLSPEPIPSFLFPQPSSPFGTNSPPSPPYPTEAGYALDNCDSDVDCQGSYICRHLSEPLVSCDLMRLTECRCAHPDPSPCTHIDQCLSGEFCVNALKPFVFEFGVCISKETVLTDFNFRTAITQFFPPESNPFPADSPTISLPVTSSGDFFVGASPSFGEGVGPSESSTPFPENPEANKNEPDTFVVPSPSLIPDVFSSPDASIRANPSPGRPMGYTLDRCEYGYACRGDRLCVDVFDTTPVSAYCNSQCYCVPKELRNCTSSSQCVIQEACVTTDEVELSYCVSWGAVAKNSVFQIIPFDDGSTDTPSFPPHPPQLTFDPTFTPFTESTEPRYIPPGYLTFTPTPEFDLAVGLTLAYCKARDDCYSGYACVSVMQYWPCSASNNRCYCIPNEGKKGTICIDDMQCPVGEICFPKRRVDIVPSYCVSQHVVDNNLRVLDRFLSTIIPRAVGELNSFPFYRDWPIPDVLPENAGTGSNLTGDLCSTSADCGENRVCAGPLASGSMCDFNCSISFCYPKYFAKCKYGDFCEKGEQCARVFGMYESTFANDFYYPRESKPVICLSLSAIDRNGYEAIPYSSPPPRKFLGNVVWENAVPILKIKLGKDAISEESRMSRFDRKIGYQKSKYMADVLGEKQSELQDVSRDRKTFLNLIQRNAFDW